MNNPEVTAQAAFIGVVAGLDALMMAVFAGWLGWI